MESAAEQYGLTLSSLLNAGAHRRLRVFAAVMNEGMYTWPNDIGSVAFPRLAAPFKQSFGVRDRVWVSPDSLLEIEARGSSVIRSFAAPDVALKLATEAALFDDAGLGGEIVLAAKTRPGLGCIAMMVSRSGKQIEPALEHLVLTQPWLPSGDPQSHTPTTLANLYVRPQEVEELLAYADGGIPGIHGNTVHNAARREQIFAAAILLLRKSPGSFKTAVSLAEGLERLPAEFWEEMQPPLGPRKIAELLARAMDAGKVLRERD